MEVQSLTDPRMSAPEPPAMPYPRGDGVTARRPAPRHRIILAVDIGKSTTYTNPAKAHLRQAMYTSLEQSLRTGGISEDHRDAFIDLGDGALILIRPVDEVPKTLVLGTVIPALAGLLAAHSPDRRLRLRVVLHAGEVHYDGRGYFGEALDIAFRLLDAPGAKHYFHTVSAPVILVVSDHIHDSIVRHGYEDIDEDAFRPRVHVRVAGRHHTGWVCAVEPETAR
jgi:hypothetical protein